MDGIDSELNGKEGRAARKSKFLSSKTSREALKRAKEKLDMTKIKTLGVAINRLNLQEYNYYYKYHYYHYYGEE